MGTPKGTVFEIGRDPDRTRHWSDAWWAASSAVLPAAAALLTRMRAIDLAYHVATGELTLRSGSVVRTDPFSFTRAGAPWRNQQWGAQLVVATAHRASGWAGVAVVYAAAVGGGFAFLYRSCRRAGAGVQPAAALTLLGFVVGATSLGARPQALAVPLFTATWLLLTRDDPWRWLVPALAVVWANVHGSFVLAPVLALFAVGDAVIARGPWRRPALIAVATAAATLLTPFGPGAWAYVIDVASDETIRATVTEWRPPALLSAIGALFWLSGLGVAGLAIARRASVRPMDVLRLAVFFALGAAALRSTLWWALAAPPVVSRWLAAAPSVERWSAPIDRRTRIAVAVASAAMLIAAFFSRAGVDDATGAPRRLAADAPQALVEATREAAPPGARLLVFQPFASWFEFALPDRPVMVDSRIELFPDDVWEDYDAMIVAGDRWMDVALRWRIDGVVLPPGAVLAPELADDPAWRLVVDGPAGSVFVRR